MFIRVPDPPKTLSPEEQSRLLEAVAREGSRRDLALLTLALGTGLRLKELVGLNVGDVATKSGAVAWKVVLPKGITKGRRRMPDGRWAPFSQHGILRLRSRFTAPTRSISEHQKAQFRALASFLNWKLPGSTS
jgi:site-specific recombinase XerC